jgi:hypothetical protein
MHFLISISKSRQHRTFNHPILRLCVRFRRGKSMIVSRRLSVEITTELHIRFRKSRSSCYHHRWLHRTWGKRCGRPFSLSVGLCSFATVGMEVDNCSIHLVVSLIDLKEQKRSTSICQLRRIWQSEEDGEVEKSKRWQQSCYFFFLTPPLLKPRFG